MSAAPRVMILTRTPRPGQVKTRLIPALGAEGAAAVHAALVRETLARIRQTGLEATICLDGDPMDPLVQGQGFPIQPQPSGDLGARMRQALAGPGRRLAIGTDCPLFSPRWLQEAVAPGAPPVVVGPAEDGGYWMLAVDAPQDALLTDIPWSTPQTLAVTLQRAAAAGLAVQQAPTCYDIDTPDDLRRLLADPRCPAELRDTARAHLR